MTKHERMAKAFAALDDDGRDFWLEVIEEEAREVQAARRPILRLIQGGPAAAAPANKPCTAARTKKKESA